MHFGQALNESFMGLQVCLGFPHTPTERVKIVENKEVDQARDFKGRNGHVTTTSVPTHIRLLFATSLCDPAIRNRSDALRPLLLLDESTVTGGMAAYHSNGTSNIQ